MLLYLLLTFASAQKIVEFSSSLEFFKKDSNESMIKFNLKDMRGFQSFDNFQQNKTLSEIESAELCFINYEEDPY